MSSNMTPQQELEARIASTAPPILVAVAIFSLTVMALGQSPKQNFVDEIFGLLGFLSLIFAAWIIDFMLDELQLKAGARFKLMNGGYFFFCLIVGIMSSGTLLLYYVKKHPGLSYSWNYSFIFFLVTGIFIVLKLMTYEDKNAWTGFTLLSFAASIAAIINSLS